MPCKHKYNAAFDEVDRLEKADRITRDQAIERRAQLGRQFDREEAQRLEDEKSPLQKRAEDRIKELQTPFAKMQEALAQIGEEFADNKLTQDQKTLAELNTRRDFLETQPEEEAVTGAVRPAALERGSAAAFSASFGPVAKPIDRLLKVNELILAQLRKMEPEAFNIGA